MQHKNHLFLNCAMQIVLIIGFAIALIGFLFGAALDAREIGASLFLVGFVVAVLGMVGRTIAPATAWGNPKFSRGIKIASIGFLIFALAIASEFLWRDGSGAKLARYLGLGICVLGIVFSTAAVRIRDE
jgi:hypothetical protein